MALLECFVNPMSILILTLIMLSCPLDYFTGDPNENSDDFNVIHDSAEYLQNFIHDSHESHDLIGESHRFTELFWDSFNDLLIIRMTTLVVTV